MAQAPMVWHMRMKGDGEAASPKDRPVARGDFMAQADNATTEIQPSMAWHMRPWRTGTAADTSAGATSA